MRTKHFIVVLCCTVTSTLLFIILGTSESSDLKNIVSHTHQQINKIQENLRVSEEKKLDIDSKYLTILGFTTSTSSATYNATKNALTSDYYKYEARNKGEKHSYKYPGYMLDVELLPNSKEETENSQSQVHTAAAHLFNGTKVNFTIVTYVQEGQAPSAILLSQNIASKFPNEYLMIYDLGLSEEELRALTAYCNNSRCTVISYDLSVFPSHVADQRMHAYRPIIIKDALIRSKSILFAENYIRIRGTSRDLSDLQKHLHLVGVLGWNSPTAVSTRTHPKMFDYFQTDADDFIFLRMVDLDTVLFEDTAFVAEKILLPWIKCALTLECIDPIGAQSNGCKYNKKPQYRYSGCHSYDTSAFNIVLGLTWHLDDSKYSLPSKNYNIFYKETLEQATKILENRRRNSSETSEHPFTDD
ncbi:uncharacterized protein LOC133337049 [Musca vetustissima]|uniref:uncharacterized protein LOC133337049 n=1 Tax=Musca vetustissima TaxID=27455 RepID=UPI002AB7CCBC|nr:uncharacterized protein LOC133337049 [Musca vetustissima]